MSEADQTQSIVSIAERLGRVEGELAPLKAANENKKPWYKDTPGVVATLAFLFSLGTTIVSYIRTEQQDVHNARTELQSYIEKISSISRDSYSLQKDYQDKPQILADLFGYLSGERVYYARQAAEIVNRIPDQVSSTEINFVTGALVQSGMYTQAAKLAEASIAKARDYIDAVAAYRSYGMFLIIQGKLQEGRNKFQAASEIFSNPKFFENSDDTKNATQFETELYWAQAEQAAHQPLEVRKHLDNANMYANKLPAGPLKEQSTARIAQFQATPPSLSVIDPNAQQSPPDKRQ